VNGRVNRLLRSESVKREDRNRIGRHARGCDRLPRQSGRKQVTLTEPSIPESDQSAAADNSARVAPRGPIEPLFGFTSRFRVQGSEAKGQFTIGQKRSRDNLRRLNPASPQHALKHRHSLRTIAAPVLRLAERHQDGICAGSTGDCGEGHRQHLHGIVGRETWNSYETKCHPAKGPGRRQSTEAEDRTCEDKGLTGALRSPRCASQPGGRLTCAIGCDGPKLAPRTDGFESLSGEECGVGVLGEETW
jgi:hypothetical protein